MSDTTYTSQATTAPSSGAGMSHAYNLSKAVHQLQTQLQGKWPTGHSVFHPRFTPLRELRDKLHITDPNGVPTYCDPENISLKSLEDGIMMHCIILDKTKGLLAITEDNGDPKPYRGKYVTNYINYVFRYLSIDTKVNISEMDGYPNINTKNAKNRSLLDILDFLYEHQDSIVHALGFNPLDDLQICFFPILHPGFNFPRDTPQQILDWYTTSSYKIGLFSSPLENKNMGIIKKLNDYSNVIAEGVAGCGKSHMLESLKDTTINGGYGPENVTTVVFHPSTSYEEFVSGLRPNFAYGTETPDFISHEGIFLQACAKAVRLARSYAAHRARTGADTSLGQDPAHREAPAHLLFIDEINRANTSRVFGDLMLVLEKSKRHNYATDTDGDWQNHMHGALVANYDREDSSSSAQPVTIPPHVTYATLQTPVFVPRIRDDGTQDWSRGRSYSRLVVPDNLHILGTMNSTDRSVGTIDLALRRRFHWHEMEPMRKDDLKEALTAAGRDLGADPELSLLVDAYDRLNTSLKNEVGPDARLGHAYFFEPKASAPEIADALLTQLAEVAATFNIKETPHTNPDFPRKLAGISDLCGRYVEYVGHGLGRRPHIGGTWNPIMARLYEAA